MQTGTCKLNGTLQRNGRAQMLLELEFFSSEGWSSDRCRKIAYQFEVTLYIQRTNITL